MKHVPLKSGNVQKTNTPISVVYPKNAYHHHMIDALIRLIILKYVVPNIKNVVILPVHPVTLLILKPRMNFVKGHYVVWKMILIVVL